MADEQLCAAAAAATLLQQQQQQQRLPRLYRRRRPSFQDTRPLLGGLWRTPKSELRLKRVKSIDPWCLAELDMVGHAGSWCERASVCPRRGGSTQRSALSHTHSCCLVLVCTPVLPQSWKGRASFPACWNTPNNLLKLQNRAKVCDWSSCVGACTRSTNPGFRMEAQRPRPARSAALAAHAAQQHQMDCETASVCVCVWEITHHLPSFSSSPCCYFRRFRGSFSPQRR